jgi:hypothetical protein
VGCSSPAKTIVPENNPPRLRVPKGSDESALTQPEAVVVC